MDRERLKEVRQTDLTEGRINEDFVDWLKTKGTSWLLVIVFALFAYAALVRWKSSRLNYQTQAWTDLSKAALPASYEDVAEKYTDVGSVSHLARIRAAGLLLNAVQAGRPLDAEDPMNATLTSEQRDDYLDKADRLFEKVVQADTQQAPMTLPVTTALSGQAVVAESKGDFDRARQFYEQAAKRAEAFYPKLAEQARDRAASIDEQAKPITLPTFAELDEIMMQAQTSAKPRPEPVWGEAWLSALLAPKP